MVLGDWYGHSRLIEIDPPPSMDLRCIEAVTTQAKLYALYLLAVGSRVGNERSDSGRHML